MGRKLQYAEVATWASWRGDKGVSPEARLLTQHVLAYYQPDKPAFLYSPEEMLVQSLGWTPEQVHLALTDLLAGDSLLTLTHEETSVLWGKYELTEKGRASRDAWVEQNRSSTRPQEQRWKQGFNAVMKFELRYNPGRGGDTLGDLLALLLASWHGLDAADSHLWSVAMLAGVLGVEAPAVLRLLPYLEQRGWNVLHTDDGLVTSPTDELLEQWRELAEALQTKGEGKHRRSGGVLESEYARDRWNWTFTNGSDHASQSEAGLGSLDYRPRENEWQIYRVSSVLDQRRYLGITSRPLRERGVEHLNRLGLVKGVDHNPGMSALYSEHEKAGLEPRIEFIEVIRGNRTWAEKREHALVVNEVKEHGGDMVMNIEHHPESGFRCHH